MKPKLVISFSGGKTSAKLAHDMKRKSDKYDMVFVMANTGKENEETLIFADRCDREFGLDLVWVEAVVHPGEEKACTHKVVTFETASRNGEPFEEVIKKYGIPNAAYLHCTRELKANPIRSYIENGLGWGRGSYRIAVGIRGDEMQRVGNKPEFVYPFAQRPHLFYEAEFADLFTTKPMVNDFWEEMPFTLNLEEHEGNCETCFKKSTRKLVRIAQDHPERFEWSARMEKLYGLAGYNEDGNPRVFYRNNMSTGAVLGLAQISKVPPILPDPDVSGGCSESCEAFG